MDTVEFDGVEYVRAAVAAKKFSYTQDYIGQLCRAKKINARLVGRTWFVAMASIEEHRDKKHKRKKSDYTPDPTAATADEASKELLTHRTPQSDHRRVSSVPRRPASAAVMFKPGGVPVSPESDTAVRGLSVRYENDEETLIPLTRKKLPPPTELTVSLSEAAEVEVSHGKESAAKFTPEPLPEISLRGSISVEELPLEAIVLPDQETDNEGIADKAYSSKDISPIRDKNFTSSFQARSDMNPIKRRETSNSTRVVVEFPDESTDLARPGAVNQEASLDIRTRPVDEPSRKMKSLSVTDGYSILVDDVPSSSVAITTNSGGVHTSIAPQTFAPRSVAERPQVPTSVFYSGLIAPVLVLILSLLIAVGILSLGVGVSVSSDSYEAGLIFVTTDIWTMVLRFLGI
jgi:hypothetical protein